MGDIHAKEKSQNLVEMQRQCDNANKDQLRNVKNLQDLINIKVKKVDHDIVSTGHKTRTRGNLSYDF